MAVHGGLTFMPGSFFAIRILPAANDRADVTGAAALNGAVSVFAGAGTYVPDTAYTIIKSLVGGVVTGSFDNVTSNFAFLTPTLSYDPNTVLLTLTRSPAAFASAAQTPNQFGVAHALDQFPSDNPLLLAAANQTPAVGVAHALDQSTSANPLLLAVVNQTLAGGRQAFDALSGEVHGSAQTAILNDSIYMRQAVLGRLRQAPFSSAAGPMAALGFGGPMIALAEAAGGYDGVPLAYADKGAPGALNSRPRLRRRCWQPQIRSTPSGGRLSAPGARWIATAMPPPPAATSPVSSPGSIAAPARTGALELPPATAIRASA